MNQSVSRNDLGQIECVDRTEDASNSTFLSLASLHSTVVETFFIFKSSERSKIQIMTTLRLVTDKDRVLLRNLFNYFIHDLASYESDIKLNQSGTFALDAFAQYFRHPGLKTFLIYSEEDVAGFIVISIPPYFSKSEDLYQVQHLFVLNGCRKRNIGSEAAEQVIQEYRGKWSISQIKSNTPAIKFWRAFYKERHIQYEEKVFTSEDVEMIGQSFVS